MYKQKFQLESPQQRIFIAFSSFQFQFCSLSLQRLSFEDHFPSDLLHVVAGEGAHRVEVVAPLALEALNQLADVGSVVVLGRRR